MSNENQRCPQCGATEQHWQRVGTLGGFGGICEGHQLQSQSVEQSPEADRGPRNASDRASLSVGAAELKQRIADTRDEVRAVYNELQWLTGGTLDQEVAHFFKITRAGLFKLEQWLNRELSKAPADNGKLTDTGGRGT